MSADSSSSLSLCVSLYALLQTPAPRAVTSPQPRVVASHSAALLKVVEMQTGSGSFLCDDRLSFDFANLTFRRSKLESQKSFDSCCWCLFINSTQPPSPDVSGPCREPQRRYKSDLRSTKHESPHRTIEAPRTPRSRGGRQYGCRFHAS